MRWLVLIVIILFIFSIGCSQELPDELSDEDIEKLIDDDSALVGEGYSYIYKAKTKPVFLWLR